MFQVLAKTWLNKRDQTDTRYDKSSKLHILIYTKNMFMVLQGIALKNQTPARTQSSSHIQTSPGNAQDPQA